jgi:FAD/FMN-containing dehydrogenase
VSPAELRGATLRGELLTEDSPGFAEACRIYNGSIAKRPIAVARCADADDVAVALGLAREHELPVSVKGGGHNVAGHALVDRGLVIDLSLLRSVAVDSERRLARAGGGCRWIDFDAPCHEHGLATPGGVVGTTGIGGLTLGGGIGHLLGPYGFTCDNLLAADVVTADGRLVRASDDGHAELLWGLRGGGGNFGVVTSFEYRLHPVEAPWGGLLVYPFALAGELLRCFRDLTAAVPDAFTTQLLAWREPDGQQGVAVAVSHVGGHEEGARVARPLRELPPLEDGLGPTDYLAVQALWGESEFGRRNYWKGSFVTELPDSLIDGALDLFARSGIAGLLVEAITGVGTRAPDDSAAFGGRRARFNVTGIGTWHDPADDERQIGWVRELAALLEPSSLRDAGYVNYMSADEPLERVRAAFGPETFARLQALKGRYDPTNVFRLNQNVPPP